MTTPREEMRMDGCQVPCLPRISTGRADPEPVPWKVWIKRSLALPWNRVVKTQAKAILKKMDFMQKNDTRGVYMNITSKSKSPATFQAGDWVRVKAREEINASLDRWQELKGCAFLDAMSEYCGTTQRVLQPLERFLDERDYKVKKCRGVVLLENVICLGTPVFGRCDRRCFLFWREEWLEPIEAPGASITAG
jgi:hypothetical protein